MPERRNLLRFSVFEHVEGVAIEGRNHALLVIDDDGVKENLVDILAKNKNSAISRLGLLGRILRRGGGGGGCCEGGGVDCEGVAGAGLEAGGAVGGGCWPESCAIPKGRLKKSKAARKPRLLV